MESRTLLPLVRPCSALHVNSVEDFDKLDHAYRETGLFQQFARHAFLQRLAQLQRSPWYRPFSKQRLAAASNQQRASLVDNYAAYANQRSFWILPRRCHLSAVYPASSREDRKSTRLNSSHANISYAVFCLKKKNKRILHTHWI